MGQVLYEKTSVFRAALDQCKAVFADATGKSLFEAMYSENKREEVAEDHKRGPQNIQTLLDQTQYTQPALFALEWSLAELWRSRGVVPRDRNGRLIDRDSFESVMPAAE